MANLLSISTAISPELWLALVSKKMTRRQSMSTDFDFQIWDALFGHSI